MKRFFKGLLIIPLFFMLFACEITPSETDYEVQYRQKIVDYQSNYETQIDFFNMFSQHYIKGTVKIEKANSGQIGFSSGSGIVYKYHDDFFYAITNNHVIGDEHMNRNQYRVIDFLGHIHEGFLVAHDPDFDLAVIKFSPSQNVGILTIPLATINSKPNDFLAVIGYPASQVNAITFGYLNQYRYLNLSTPYINIEFDVMETSVPLRGGSSGSGVFNDQFQIVGIVYAGIKSMYNFIEPSYAIPVEKVREFLYLYESEGTNI